MIFATVISLANTRFVAVNVLRRNDRHHGRSPFIYGKSDASLRGKQDKGGLAPAPPSVRLSPGLPRPGLSLSTMPLINGSSAASRGSIRRGSGFQHTSQLPHKVTEHGAQDGGDDDKE